MDPRHPELALSRLKELIKQYDEIEYRISHATTSAGISQAEREGGLVVQEMCLVAPRIHEAMIQASRNRRHDLTHGVVVDMSKYEVPEGALDKEVEEEPEEELTFEQQSIKYTLELDKEIEEREKQEVESKPKLKKTARKKTTKKKAGK